jgi:hypothetical protein
MAEGANIHVIEAPLRSDPDIKLTVDNPQRRSRKVVAARKDRAHVARSGASSSFDSRSSTDAEWLFGAG